MLISPNTTWRRELLIWHTTLINQNTTARKLEKGASVAKEVSSPVVEKAKGKTGPEPDATEAKRESERVKNKERREEK